MSRAAAASPHGHVFRDGYAAVPGSGTLAVLVAQDAPDVAFERCGSFRVEDPAARASVVGAFGGSGVGAAVVPVRQRLDVAEQGGAPAALQFASLPVGGTGAQVLMQASKRDGDDQVALWSLQTAGPDRQSVQLYNESNPLQPDGALAFEFDLAKQWLITAPKGNTVNSGDPTTDNVINNMRTRIAELEAIIQDIAKNAVRRPPAS